MHPNKPMSDEGKRRLTCARKHITRALGISENNPFSLLKEIGGECAGAITLYPEDVNLIDENQFDIVSLTQTQLQETINNLNRKPLEGARLSLAGAQDKLAVKLLDNTVHLTRHNTPSSHIIKPMIKEFPSSIYNEFYCMQLAKQANIMVPDTKIMFANDLPFYIIERYDRTTNKKGELIRLHQEDFCQVLGIPPQHKYQREGGPSIAQCLEVIDKYSAQPALDKSKFLKIIIFNYIIGNADAHGKNFSFLYDAHKRKLTNAYDLLSTTVYPGLDIKMAMKIGGKYKPEDIRLKHWHSLVENTALARKNVEYELHSAATALPMLAKKLSDELNKTELQSEIYQEITAIINQRAKRLLSYL